jgi:hypothetical protein
MKEGAMESDKNGFEAGHPSREDWVCYLYGEVDEPVKRTLEAHLEGCAECRERLHAWRGAMGLLDRWDPGRAVGFPAHAPGIQFRREWRSWIPWLGMAASFFLCVGILLGRFTVHRAVEEAVSSAMAEWETQAQTRIDAQRDADLQEMRARLIKEEQGRADAMKTAMVHWVDTRILEERALVTRRLEKMGQEWASSYLLLRRNLELLAKQADQGLRQARTGLAWLASRKEEETADQGSEGNASEITDL